MKALRLLLIFTIILLANTFVRAEDSEVGKILSGDHRLGKVGVLATVICPDLDTTKKVNPDSYFVCVSRKVDDYVIFSWNYEKEYIISKIPVSKIRVRYEEVEKPYVKFKWKPSSYLKPPMQQIIDEYVIYVVFVCKQEVWNPSNVNTNVIVEKSIRLEKEDEDYNKTSCQEIEVKMGWEEIEETKTHLFRMLMYSII